MLLAKCRPYVIILEEMWATVRPAPIDASGRVDLFINVVKQLAAETAV